MEATMSAFETTRNRGTQLEAKRKYRGSNCHDALHRRERENHVGLHDHWSFSPVRPVPRFDARIAVAEYESDARHAGADDKGAPESFVGYFTTSPTQQVCFICR